MQSTAFHVNAVLSEILNEMCDMNETVRQVLMMTKAENQAQPQNQPPV